MKSLTANNHDKKLPALLLASFAAASAVILAVYIASGMQPFGKLSILTSDMLIQYKDYYGYLWDVLHGQASLDYSFSKSLGGGMAGLVAYYLTCPLNLFVYFIEKTVCCFPFAMRCANIRLFMRSILCGWTASLCSRSSASACGSRSKAAKKGFCSSPFLWQYSQTGIPAIWSALWAVSCSCLSFSSNMRPKPLPA